MGNRKTKGKRSAKLDRLNRGQILGVSVYLPTRCARHQQH